VSKKYSRATVRLDDLSLAILTRRNRGGNVSDVLRDALVVHDAVMTIAEVAARTGKLETGQT
jgi:hypothetical protein